MQQSFIHLYVLSAVISLILALGLLVSKNLQALPARLLGINYGLYAIQNFLAVLVLGFSWEFATILRAAMAMTLGPAIYFYYSSLLGQRHWGRGVWLFHLLPALIVLGLWVFQPALLWTLDFLIIGSFTAYLLVIIRLLIGGEQRLAHLAQYAAVAYRWLVILAALMVVNLLIEVLASVEMSRGIPLRQSKVLWLGAGFFLLFHGITLVLVLTRAPLTEWMHALKDLRLSKVKPLSDAEAQVVFDRWQHMVFERELHKREGGVTLEQAGKILGIPARQISQSINRIYGASFSQFLNDYRVKAAQQLLLEHEDMPVTTLMMEAGFSTKSNFNKEFLRVTGVAPSEYRKQADGKKA